MKEWFEGRILLEEEDEHPWRGAVIWLIVALLIAGWLDSVYAERSEPPLRYTYAHPSGSESGRLYNTPCTDQRVLRYIPEQFHVYAKAAAGLHQGTRYVACWLPGGAILIFVWEDGGISRVPMELAKEIM
jgi:hypothetical protein